MGQMRGLLIDTVSVCRRPRSDWTDRRCGLPVALVPQRGTHFL